MTPMEPTGTPQAQSTLTPRRIRGREFSPSEITAIARLVESRRELSRRALSQEVCHLLGWVQPNGRLKDRACRSVLLELDRVGLIELPPPRIHWRPRPRPISIPALSPVEGTEQYAPGTTITVAAGRRAAIELVPVTGTTRRAEVLWNEYVERYHYLGHAVVVGPHIKYFIEGSVGRLGCVAFGGAAWKVAARDRWIGWSDSRRRHCLDRIINQTRCLLFPWVRWPCLASQVLSLCARQVPRDWEAFWGVCPWLMETFVDLSRHRGTCYVAANWIELGETTGRGKWSRSKRPNRSRKGVFVYPLCRRARRRLAGEDVLGRQVETG